MKKVAIFGYNRLSLELFSRLNLDEYQLLIVDQNAAQLKLAKSKGIETALIDFRNDDELRSIGIGEDIEVIFCFFPDDVDNVFLTISARALDKKLHIIAIIESPGVAEKLLAAGANKIIAPYEICGRKIYELIKKPDMTHILDQTVFGQYDLNMGEVKILQGSYLENTYVGNLKLKSHYNLILIGIVNAKSSEKLHFSVSEVKHKISADDILVVMGPSREIEAFREDVKNV